jgi:riboflavin kinase/FMN adenylyltransferase
VKHLQILRNIREVIKLGTVATIGGFDGVHIGHTALIESCLHNANVKNLKSAVFTFMNNAHLPQKPDYYITNPSVRKRIFEQKNIDYLILQDFDDNFAKLSPEDFFEQYIINLLNVKILIVGAVFCFGYKARGNINLLARLCQTNEIELIVVPPICVDNVEVSSSGIRAMIAHGDLRAATQHLGRSFTISGIVEHGDGRGKTIGFPTANSAIDERQIMPPHGVYVTRTYIGGENYISVTSFGGRPTFDDKITIETHILGFDADIYGEEIFVEFLQYIRSIEKYDSIAVLAQTLKNDCQYAENMLTNAI